MIDRLPPEVIEIIAGYLPTASAITSLSHTNKKLHKVVTQGQNAIFHDFVHRQFPTIATDPPWQKAAARLTSRSRAWDRRAFIARECVPPTINYEEVAQNFRGQQFGFMPVIDSYETACSGSSRDKEVLAWGAAGRLQLRTTRGKYVEWSTLSFPNDTSPQTDILDLRLLRPHQNRNVSGESVFIRRANRELALLKAVPGDNCWQTKSRFLVDPEAAIDCVDISDDAEPMLAVCNTRTVQLFPVHTSKVENRAATIAPLSETESGRKHRKRCAKFLSGGKLAIAPQYLEGAGSAAIEVYDVTPTGMSSSPLQAIQKLATNKHSHSRFGANVLANVNNGMSIVSRPSNLLLSGWSDGVVRLFDLRTNRPAILEFSDPVDDGQILSVLPFGQEKFLAGSHQNACLKVFDMRMSSRVYNHQVAGRRTTATACTSSEHERPVVPARVAPSAARDINIFLAFTIYRAARPWEPLPRRQQSARHPRYRGSIYSLSSPSPSSQTVYAGIENHVIQLDFMNTDDWVVNRGGTKDQLDDRPVFNLSCYERPRLGHESTDTVLLRKQKDLDTSPDDGNNSEPGWDERWVLEQRRTRKGRTGSWRTGRS